MSKRKMAKLGRRSPPKRRLVKLADRYPGTSRMTRWRWKQIPDFPKPIIINKTPYFYEDEIEAFEEARRKPSSAAAESGESAA